VHDFYEVSFKLLDKTTNLSRVVDRCSFSSLAFNCGNCLNRATLSWWKRREKEWRKKSLRARETIAWQLHCQCATQEYGRLLKSRIWYNSMEEYLFRVNLKLSS